MIHAALAALIVWPLLIAAISNKRTNMLSGRPAASAAFRTSCRSYSDIITVTPAARFLSFTLATIALSLNPHQLSMRAA
jgi:hypothetical protein